MNFLKSRWKGIILFSVVAAIIFLICHFSLGAESRYAKVSLPILFDIVLFIASWIIKMDYGKWPWQLSRKEWQKVWEMEKSKKSCT